MKPMTLIAASLSTVMLGGCSMEGKVDSADLGKVTACVDLRDGERFMFKAISIKDISVGLFGADSCFTVTDESGTERRLCKSSEAWMKCESSFTTNEQN